MRILNHNKLFLAVCKEYRSAIFYVQLSPEINTKIIEMTLKATYSHPYNSVSEEYGVFHMLFLNDDMGILMLIKKSQNNWNYANEVCQEYSSNYLKANYQYLKTLSQLFQIIGLYSKDHYPSEYDLCIVISDNERISCGQKIKETVLQSCNKLIRISTANNDDILVERVIKSL